MRSDDDLCQFGAVIPEHNTRMAVEHSLNRGFKMLMDEIERVGRTPDWATLEIVIEPQLHRYGLTMRGSICAVGPKITKEDIEKAIAISVKEPLRGND